MSINFTNLSSGAKFVRADLHIHSFGDDGSYDVTDATMTPEAIVETAIEKDLSIISITDHNEIGNVKRALKHAEGRNILLIPGIEITTTQGHLLVYFADFEGLKNFYGKLTISSNKETCNQGIVECLTQAEAFGGFGVLAHIELGSGFEKMIGRFNIQLEDVVCHSNLLALEISQKENSINYTDQDTSSDRKGMLKKRLTRLGLPEGWEFPMLMSSDAHKLMKLGLNADGNKKLTRFKMDTLSFQGVKIALQNSTSRIRLEDLIPEKTPCFLGIEIEGGLLDKQRVHFNKNLTCIIGGRGAGKSTLLHCIKETSGNGTSPSVLDSEAWPDKIHLLYEDETGQQILLSREKNGELINVNDPVNGLTNIEIETYGQGETEDTIKNSDNDPASLLTFLDSFIEFETLKSEEEATRLVILENQSQIDKLRLEVANIPETEKQKLHHEGKLEHLKRDKVSELVTYQTALINERNIRKTISDDLAELKAKYLGILDDNSVFDAFQQLTETDIEVGKDNFKNVKKIVSEFGTIVTQKSTELNGELEKKLSELRIQISDWASKEFAIQANIDAKKVELDKAGIPFDLGLINQIVSNVSYYQNLLKQLKIKEAELVKLLADRSKLITDRKELLRQIHNKRFQFSLKIKENLKSSVDGFFVNLKFEAGKYNPNFERYITAKIGWRTTNVQKGKLLSRFISPLDFAECIRKKNFTPLIALVDKSGMRVFSDAELVDFTNKLCSDFCYEDFESLPISDWPTLTVTKMVKQPNGPDIPHTKSIAQLSLGQQQSIILGILLHSNSKVPLLIDQPEDNLDSEFIYKTIVTILKRIKETRQVIIVTHNANIAVLGDAELIVPLKSTSIKSLIVDSGSIDREETRAICCEILEGGKQAFIKRKEIYGI